MAALDWSQCSGVESIPGKVSGTWVLKGTRTPVKVVFENLEAGMSEATLNCSTAQTLNQWAQRSPSYASLDAHPNAPPRPASANSRRFGRDPGRQGRCVARFAALDGLGLREPTVATSDGRLY
ncbi:MAG: DUF433 domain-containing protein [Acidobacteriaceae bacterium]|nr:DUF433 domain-containing protein [Acidobacteriaceae bacterium]